MAASISLASAPCASGGALRVRARHDRCWAPAPEDRLGWTRHRSPSVSSCGNDLAFRLSAMSWHLIVSAMSWHLTVLVTGYWLLATGYATGSQYQEQPCPDADGSDGAGRAHTIRRETLDGDGHCHHSHRAKVHDAEYQEEGRQTSAAEATVEAEAQRRIARRCQHQRAGDHRAQASRDTGRGDVAFHP